MTLATPDHSRDRPRLCWQSEFLSACGQHSSASAGGVVGQTGLWSKPFKMPTGMDLSTMRSLLCIFLHFRDLIERMAGAKSKSNSGTGTTSKSSNATSKASNATGSSAASSARTAASTRVASSMRAASSTHAASSTALSRFSGATSTPGRASSTPGRASSKPPVDPKKLMQRLGFTAVKGPVHFPS